MCDQIADKDLRKTMDLVLTAEDPNNVSTKVVRGTEARQENKQRRKAVAKEVERLRLELRDKFHERGITDFQGVFARFDTNRDGFFNEVEFQCAFQVMGVQGFSQEKLRRLLRVADKDKNGKIDYEEFEAFLNAKSLEQEAEDLENSAKSSVQGSGSALGVVKESKFELEDDQ